MSYVAQIDSDELRKLRTDNRRLRAIAVELRIALVIARQWMPVHPIDGATTAECSAIDHALMESRLALAGTKIAGTEEEQKTAILK